MEHTIWSALFTNAALLLALSVVYELTYLLPSRYRRFQPVYSGLMIAAICLAIMRMPFAFQPGLVYDTRSIIISVTALIFGPVPTFITVAVAVIFRLGLGGLGTLPGIAVILSSALIGLAWRRWVHVKPGKRRWLNILLMSITVHVAMLACTLLVPYPDNIKVIRAIAAPVMILYPLASILLSLLLLRQREYRNAQETLNKSEEWFRALFEKAPLGYQSLDIDGNFIEVNRQWLDTLGYDRSEVIGKPFGDFVSRNILRPSARGSCCSNHKAIFTVSSTCCIKAASESLSPSKATSDMMWMESLNRPIAFCRISPNKKRRKKNAASAKKNTAGFLKQWRRVSSIRRRTAPSFLPTPPPSAYWASLWMK